METKSKSYQFYKGKEEIGHGVLYGDGLATCHVTILILQSKIAISDIET